MRIACVYVPDLPLQAVLRRNPEHRDEPVALAETPGERARVLACTRSARQAGVVPGQLVSQARAAASGLLGANKLRVIPASAADTEATTAALADVGYAFAPRVEAEGERLFLEVGELTGLYPAGERAVAQAIAAQAARLGLMARVGIAASKAVARVAAQAAEVAVVPEGQAEARRFLSPLSVDKAIVAGTPAAVAADVDDGRATLGRWGIRTLGALAGLPAAEVALRLGRFGVWLHRLAGGLGEELFVPQLPPDALEEGTELDYPLYEIEPVAFVLRGLLDRALARLACRGLACAGLSLRLKLDPRGFDVRDVPLAAPTRETATLLQLVRLDLARRPPSSPVVGVTALLLPARVRASQLDLWRPAGPAPEALAATLARLSALVGPENVGSPALVDSFREEAVALAPFRPDTARATPPEGSGVGEARLGFRRFRPPEPVEVLMDRDGPSALRGRNLIARVLVAAGPYRSSGAWWTEESFSRDYWDVQASDGAVYRLHQDRNDGTWWADGYYD
jgi:protein ImuB